MYEAVAVPPPPEPLPSTRSSTLLVKFVKVASKAFDIQHTEEEQKSVLAEQKRISRLLVPFVTSPALGQTFSGVFFTGDRPSWILSTDKGGVKVFPSGHNVVQAFTTSSLWESRGDFLLYSEEVSLYANHAADRNLLNDVAGPQPRRMDARRPARRPSPCALRPTLAAVLQRRV